MNTRRQFIQKTGLLVAGSFVVPSWFSGCGGAVEKNADWEQRAATLESSGTVYSKADPGKWAGKENGHTPSVVFNANGTVTVKTAHVMTAEHWITMQYVKNQDGIVIALREHPNTNTAAELVLKLPINTTRLTAYSHCNLHDHWTGEQVAV